MDVTVIVPAYNSAATIADCLRSIGAQSKPAASVILVDDRSTDNTVDIARDAGVTNLEVITLARNGGPGAARNAGVAHARTEWIAFLDADDLWEPTFLAEVCDAIADFGADYGSAGGMRVTERTAVSGKARLLPGPRRPMDLTRSFWKIAMRFMPIDSSTAVIRRALYDTAGGFQEDVRHGEDVSLWLRLWLQGRYVFVNRPLYRRVTSAGSLSTVPRTYREVWNATGTMARTVLRAIRMRKPGSGWLVIWFARSVVRRHGAWLRGRGAAANL